LRLLRVDNLLCVRRRKFLLGTTDSKHRLPDGRQSYLPTGKNA
jgi:hypothetical protein